MQNKKIIIAGGTGFIGQAIAQYFGKENEILILTKGIKNEKTNAHGYQLDNASHIFHINKYHGWKRPHRSIKINENGKEYQNYYL